MTELAPTLAQLILRNARVFGHVLVVRCPEDASIAVRCERCFLTAEYPLLMSQETKTRLVRLFIAQHKGCADAVDPQEPEKVALQ